jgi:hypothetical protein
MSGIPVPRKKMLKTFRQPMGVDDEALHSAINQMIERERDERLLENGDKRLGQIIG